MSETVHQLYAIVSGSVQGVNFRYYTCQTALALGITGWVRNRISGEVEVLAEGTREQLTQFLDFLHRGSPAAVVSDVQTTWSEARRKYKTFSIAHTN